MTHREANTAKSLISGFSVLLILFCAVSGLAQSAAQNLGFEQGEAGGVPPGWRVPSKGYAAQLTRDNPKAGTMCAELTRRAIATAAPFGNLMQTFDATPFRGKRVRLRAAVRLQPATGDDHAQLWMSVDRPRNQRGFSDKMEDHPIKGREWAYYEIVGEVAPDATRINIGVILDNSGTLWIDDVSFDVVGEAEKK